MIFLCIALVVALVYIFLVPSGKQCPDCNSYCTAPFKALAVKHSDSKQVHLLFDNCFKCGAKFNLMEDGKPVNEDKE